MFAAKPIGEQLLVVSERCAEVNHALEMGVQTTATDLVSTGFGVGHFAQTRQQRSNQHHRTAEFVALL